VIIVQSVGFGGGGREQKKPGYPNGAARGGVPCNNSRQDETLEEREVRELWTLRMRRLAPYIQMREEAGISRKGEIE